MRVILINGFFFLFVRWSLTLAAFWATVYVEVGRDILPSRFGIYVNAGGLQRQHKAKDFRRRSSATVVVTRTPSCTALTSDGRR